MNFNLKAHHDDLLFLPLGGANEIGMNLNLYHLDGKWIMIDCGVGFANDVPGIDMMVPDITFIKQNRKNLLAIILTHIHEDHMGAVQYLWEELKVPVYATNFGKNFLLSKLKEFKLDNEVPINVIKQNQELNLGPFNIDFIGLTHSVPEMQALMIKTKKGNILHTGDWKFDPEPVVGKVSDKEKIKSYANKGQIDVMVCDSTNAISPGHSKSEGDLYESLKKLMVDRKGLIGVTTFASNIARIFTINKIAKELGRKVVLAGFALHRIIEVARKSEYFGDEIQFISDREIKNYKKSEILVICTGCQGELLAATRKIAFDNHPNIRFTKGDLMIFSSKIIPGNEKKIFELFDGFAKNKVDVMTEKDHFVHVSGHPSRDELREIYDLAKPRLAIPVHGEFIHTKAHCEIATDCGTEKVIQVENGLVIKIDSDNIQNSSNVGFVNSGYYGVDGRQLIDLGSDVIKERRKLKHTGIIVISCIVDQNLNLVNRAKIKSIGCYDLKNDQEMADILESELKKMLKTKSQELGINKNKFSIIKKKSNKTDKISENLEKTIRSRFSKAFEDVTGKKPVIEVNIFIT